MLSVALIGVACDARVGDGEGTETVEETGDTGDGDGDTRDGDGDGDGDTGDGDGDGDGGEYPNCGVGGDATVISSYINFDNEQPDAEYHEICTVASVSTQASETTVLFDCPDDQHPGLAVTAQPVWTPNLAVGTPVDVHLEWLGKWSSGEWTYGTTWRLANVDDSSIIAAHIDVHRWYGEAPLGMHAITGLCEPEGFCEGQDGPLPRTQSVGLEFTVGDEMITLFAGNSAQLGDYDIWVAQANDDACEDELDGAPGLYTVLIARQQ
jgi:hypothetical protein